MSPRSYAVAKATDEIARLINQIGASGEEIGCIPMGSVFDIYEAAMFEAGWRWMPLEATPDMLQEVGKYNIQYTSEELWRDVLKVAPSPGDES